MEDAYLFRHGLAPSRRRPALEGLPQTLPVLLNRGFMEHPEATALTTAEGSHSYDEVFRGSQTAAAVLSDWGVAAGDRVAGGLPDGFPGWVAFLGAMRLGAVWVALPAAAPLERKLEILADTEACWLLADRATHDAIEPHRAQLRDLARVTVADDAGEWQLELERETDLDAYQEVDPFAPAWIGFAADPDAGPQGLVHSQHGLLLPGHAAAASGVPAGPVALGSWDDPSALALGPLLELQTASAPAARAPGLVCAAAPGEVTRRAEDDPAGSLGRASDHLEIVVLDAEGRSVPDGEEGELALGPAGSGTFAGAYSAPLGCWNRPEATRALRLGGYVRTGRRGHVDAEGYVFPAA